MKDICCARRRQKKIKYSNVGTIVCFQKHCFNHIHWNVRVAQIFTRKKSRRGKNGFHSCTPQTKLWCYVKHQIWRFIFYIRKRWSNLQILRRSLRESQYGCELQYTNRVLQTCQHKMHYYNCCACTSISILN